MGMFADTLRAERAQAERTPTQETLPTSLRRGFDAGVLGAGSQLQSLAGGVGEAAGFDDFARNRNADAADLQRQAQEAAPQVQSYKQVNSLRSGGNYVAGLLGGSVPIMGAGLAGGLATGGAGAIPAVLGAAAATAPFEIGDVLQKQQADPEAMRLSAGERLGNAAVSGGLSAGLQGIVPGMVTGKLLGRGAEALAGRSLKSMAGQAALDVPLEALTEGGGEAIKQTGANQGKPLDWDAITENAIGGAAAGGALGGVGLAGDVVHANMGAIKNVATNARTAVSGAVNDGKDALGGAADAAPKKVASIWDDLSGFARKGRAKPDDTVDRVANGQPLGDLDKLATAQGETLRNLVNLSDNETVQKAKTWATEMANDAGLTPERRQAAADAMQNLSAQGGAAAVAAMKKTYDAGKSVADKISAFAQVAGAGFRHGAEQAEAKTINERAAKRSDDDSGYRKVFRDSVVPAIMPILQDMPGMFDRQDSVNQMGDALRLMGEKIAQGPLDSDAVAKAIDVFGDRTVDVLSAVHNTMRELNTGAKRLDTERFFKNLNEIDAIQKRTASLHDTIAQSLTEEAKGSTLSSDIPGLTRLLVAHARGEFAARGGERSAEETLTNTRVADMLKEHFGPKADFVSKAIEKEAGQIHGADESPVRLDENGQEIGATEGGFDESGRRLEAEGTDTIVKGRGKNNEPVMHPGLFASNREPGQNYAAQYMKDMQAKYPDHDVRFEYAEGSKTHGHVVAEKAADPTSFSEADMDELKHDTKKFPNSPSRLQVGDLAIDAVKVAKVMRRKGFEGWEGPNPTTNKRNLVDAFKRGIAQLTERAGEVINVPDAAVIGHTAGTVNGRMATKALTWGEAKAMPAARSAADKASDQQTQLVHEYRKRIAEATWSDKKLAEHGLEHVPVNDEALQNMKKALRDLESGRELARAAEMTKYDGRNPRAEAAEKLAASEKNEDGQRRLDEPFEEPSSEFEQNEDDGGGKRTAGGMTRDLETRGITARSKDEQIHQAAIGKGVNREPVKSNMAGGAHHVSDRVLEPRNDLVMTVAEWGQVSSGPAKKIAERAKVLLASYDSMGKADRRAFQLLVGKSPAEASSVVNDLARKYKDVVVEPGDKTESIRAKKGTPHEKNPVTFKDGKKVEGSPAEPGTSLMAKAIAKRMDYLVNPPADYSPKTAEGHVAWAEQQLERVRAEAKKAEGDRVADLDELATDLKVLVQKGKKVLEGDESLKDFEGSTPSPKALAAKKAALLEAASSSDPALLKELATSTDAKGLQRAIEVLPPGKASDAANARLAELVQDPDVAYSMQAASVGTSQTANLRADVEAHIEQVLAQSVKVKWAKLTHAGEFERMRTTDVIRLSVHALDPMSVAHHESLHAFFAQLKDAKATDITQVLETAAASPHVRAQLQEIFKGEPAVLAQLKDPEERAAYMYQLWAAGKLQVGPKAKSVFRKIADFIRSTLGIWTNDQRALHIMEYFHSGEYAKNLGTPSAVRRHLMEAGHSQVLETAKSFTAPLAKLADAVIGTGSGRLRDTGVPSLIRLADLVKRDALQQGGDQGFIQAARVEGTKRRGALGALLAAYTPEQLNEAMEALQKGQAAASVGAQAAAAAIKGFLADTKAYMVKAGVQLGDLGPDYFPRVWDTHYVSKHQQDFLDMLEPYVRSGEFKGNPREFMAQLGARDGAEFGIETRTPGMQFRKERKLAFIKPEDAAMFVSKDLFGTLNSYINQATRRAEWNRRLGDGQLESLFERAKAEGATPEQLSLADQYLKGIDGTLGDNINPHARRIMGNMIVYQNVRLLPMAMFSMLIDPMGVMVRGGTMGEAWSTFKRGMAAIPESFGRATHTDEASRLAELVGVVDNAMMSQTMGDLYTQGMVGGTAQKINNAFFKYNMVEGLNRSFRIGASEAAMHFMARHAAGKSSVHSKRWMGELGVMKGDIQATPDGRIALTEADGLSPEQVTRVHAAINQWVDGAMLRPDAADKPIWMNDPHFALISHLKQFVFAFQKVIIGRVVHEIENGNYTPAMALASYVPIMMAADFAKGMIQGGGDTPEWKKGWGMDDYIGSGIQRAGLLGVGQFGFDVAEDVQRGGMGLGALAGPTIEQFADSVQLLGGHKQFGPFVLDALPANALYKESLGGASTADPVVAE